MKHKLIIGALSALATLLAAPANAIDRGQESEYDYRIRTVVYNPLDTVQINGVAGLAVQIRVAPGEKYVGHVFGEKGGWSFTHVKNNFFFRPQAPDSDTNLTIITDRRTYHVLLRYIGSYKATENGETVDKFIETPWSMKKATVELRYTYPEEEAARKAAAEAENLVDEALENADEDTTSDSGYKMVNLRYRMSNDPVSSLIEPKNVWDSYTKTFFKFEPNAPLPTVFAVGPDGRETVVNVRVQGQQNNVLVANRTAAQWRIRYGDMVVGLVNDGFNPSIGGHPSATVSPAVERVLKPSRGDGS